MELEPIGSILERVLLDIASKTPEGPAMYEKYVLPQLQRAKEERMSKDNLLEIKVTKATLFLYETELMRILCKEPELFTTAINRGKAIKRARESEKRNEPLVPIEGEF